MHDYEIVVYELYRGAGCPDNCCTHIDPWNHEPRVHRIKAAEHTEINCLTPQDAVKVWAGDIEDEEAS